MVTWQCSVDRTASRPDRVSGRLRAHVITATSSSADDRLRRCDVIGCRGTCARDAQCHGSLTVVAAHTSRCSGAQDGHVRIRGRVIKAVPPLYRGGKCIRIFAEVKEAYAKASLKKYRQTAARNEDKKVFSGLL